MSPLLPVLFPSYAFARKRAKTAGVCTGGFSVFAFVFAARYSGSSTMNVLP